MAATTLVAELAENKKDGSRDEVDCLMACLRTMKEMENTEIVARNVYKIVQTIMRVCNVGDALQDLSSLPSASPATRQDPFQALSDPSLVGQSQTTLAMWPALDFEGMNMDETFSFSVEQPMLDSEPAGFLSSMEPCF